MEVGHLALTGSKEMYNVHPRTGHEGPKEE